MAVNTLDINKNSSISLARNNPVALIVGAGSFLGSSLVDKLLVKNIQVVGFVDEDFYKKQNLEEASKNKNFHLISSIPLDFDLDRLDYLIIVPSKNLELKKILRIFNEKKCRLLLVSSVDLYSEEGREGLGWLKKIESEIADAAGENKSNARVLRLGAVYGPKMEFERPFGVDPITKLINQALTDNLQKEISLEFSSRALYIDDAVNLAIKCILAGATAQKIFDGVMPQPIKVSEIKQVLLDPVWHENRNFSPSDLPPWTTPNLDKTIKFLNWHPTHNIIENLKKTLSYFKDNEINVESLKQDFKEEKNEDKDDGEWSKEKKEALDVLKKGKVENKPARNASASVAGGEVGERKKFKLPVAGFFLSFAIILIGYSLVWPLVAMGWGVLTFRYQIAESIKSLEKGDFEKSLFAVDSASYGISEAKSIYHSLDPIRRTGILESQFEAGDNLANIADLSIASTKNTILGIQALYKSLSAVTGENNTNPKEFFDASKIHLASADEDLSKEQALMESQSFKDSLPGILKDRVSSLSEKLKSYSNLVKKGRAISTLLPEVVGEGNKSYLVLFQNNNELRPTGGFIGSIAKVTFEASKLKKLEVNDVYAIDGQLSIHVEPPKEIVSDLGQKDYFLRDSNWEPDFPTAAKQVEWFYNKETGTRVEGVVALDMSAAEDLLRVLGPLDLVDYSEKVGADNLFERSITHAEVNFFPGTQSKKSFLTALTQGLFNKLFFLPNQNWPGIVSSLGRSMEGKHMSIYLDNPKLFSYLVSQNWAQLLPRPSEEKDTVVDFLAPVEANLGANKVNYYLDRNYQLDTVIGKDGEINHKLKVSYTNRSVSDAFPGGKYKNRMRVYLPNGTKLSKVLWGETNITGSVSSFVDYGRSGFSFLLELSPKEQKTLIIEYANPEKLKFDQGKASYRIDVVKQAGTIKDPFQWSLTYPINMKILSSEKSKISPQEQIIKTDLSKDRSFEVEFSK